VTDLKKQSQHPRAALPACDGCSPKKQSETLAIAAACLRVTDRKKQSQHPGAALPACDGCSPKKQSETLRSAAACLRVTDRTNQLISYQFWLVAGLGPPP
jgi:hypothetical protein